MSLLAVHDLKVSFPTSDGLVQAVRGVSFSVDRGRTLGIVGESGSGKSVCTQSLLGLTPGADISGEAIFDGRDLLTMHPDELRKVRGAQVAAIFQDPLSSLHPLYRVGWQIVEMIRAHRQISKARARSRAIELLSLVGIPQPQTRIDDYPHQFSGGMRQRVMIAMALALDPALIIADEPTTALDATVQIQVLVMLRRLQREFGMGVIFVTHDLGVAAQIADKVAVMYAGRIIEYGTVADVLLHPAHPYTLGLLSSTVHGQSRGTEIEAIPGSPPDLRALPPGCSFAPRCRFEMPACTAGFPARSMVGADHVASCLRVDDVRRTALEQIAAYT
jgi:oligopeptide/dipeptide ABC transporter ATP-binding protein